jgi:hypothetical protein
LPFSYTFTIAGTYYPLLNRQKQPFPRAIRMPKESMSDNRRISEDLNAGAEIKVESEENSRIKKSSNGHGGRRPGAGWPKKANNIVANSDLTMSFHKKQWQNRKPNFFPSRAFDSRLAPAQPSLASTGNGVADAVTSESRMSRHRPAE